MGKLLPAQAILKELRNSLQNVSYSFLERDTLLWKRCLTSAQRITDMCYEGTLKFIAYQISYLFVHKSMNRQ